MFEERSKYAEVGDTTAKTSNWPITRWSKLGVWGCGVGSCWFHYLVIGCHLKRGSNLLGCSLDLNLEMEWWRWVATHCVIRTISKVSVSDYFASRYPISLSIVNYLIFVYMLFWLSIIPTVFDYLSLNAFDGLTHLYYQLLAWILIWQLLFLLGPVGRCRRSRFEPPWGSKGLQFDRHWNNVCVFATNGKRWVLVGNQLIFIDFWTLDIFKDSLLKSFYWWLAFQLIVGLGKPAQLNAFPHCFLAEDSSQFSRIHLEVQPLPSPLRTPSIA